MDYEKQMQAYERDPSYFFLLVMALLCALALAIFSGCNRADDSLPMILGDQDNNSEVDDPDPLPDLVADFEATPIVGAAPLTVEFAESSNGAVSSRLWQFGDGGESASSNPVHVYTEPGVYAVTLKVCDKDERECVCQRLDYIKVIEAPPTAAFHADLTSGPAFLAVQFSDDSEGAIEQWSWDFGDGETSIESNPSHVYDEPGDYAVSLLVSGPGGEKQTVYENYIHVRTAEVDLSVTGLSVQGLRYKAGDHIPFSALIQNQGMDDAGESRITVYLSSDMTISEDDAVIFDDLVGGAEATGSSEVSFVATVPGSVSRGFYMPLVRVTAPEHAVDTDESNNDYMPMFLFTFYETVRIAPRADTFVSSNQPYDVFGTVPALATSYQNDGEDFSMIQMAFNLEDAEIGQDARIAGANLNLYAISTTGEDAQCLEVYAIEESWSEDTCDWDNGPFPEPEMWACACTPQVGWIDIDLSELTQAWLEGSVINNGVALYTWTEDTAYAFHSRESDISAFHPYLEIEIEPRIP